jgi:hypothetical protein
MISKTELTSGKSTSQDVRIRVSTHQKIILKELAENEGFKTISGYVRSKIFNDLSLHSKINKILVLLSEERKTEVKNEQRRYKDSRADFSKC